MDKTIFFRQLGQMVVSHSHGTALIRFHDLQNELSPQERVIGQTLLRFSSGFTRANIRFWLLNNKLAIDKKERGVLAFNPVASPLILYSGITAILGDPLNFSRMLSQSHFEDLVVASYVTSLVFDQMERNSKQQVLHGLPILVREIAPAILTLLPGVEPRHYSHFLADQSIDDLKAEGRLILLNLEHSQRQDKQE